MFYANNTPRFSHLPFCIRWLFDPVYDTKNIQNNHPQFNTYFVKKEHLLFHKFISMAHEQRLNGLKKIWHRTITAERICPPPHTHTHTQTHTRTHT